MTDNGAVPPDHDAGPSLLDRAFLTGALVTIATGGALLGLGIREGEIGRVLRLVGRNLLERMGVASATAPLTSVTLGYVHHLVVATVWGVLLGLIVLSLRGVVRIVAAIAAAALYAIIALRFLPPLLRIGGTVTSDLPSVVPIAVALSVALLGGAWLAAADNR